MEWEIVKELFRWEGSWRDIYVLQTDRSDWQNFLDSLRAERYLLGYFIDGVEAAMPDEIDRIFAIHDTATPLLTIDLEKIQVNCHFFVENEIEFDIDPRQIDGQDTLDRLLDFIRFIGMTTNKNAILTHENYPNRVIIEYQLNGDRFQKFSAEISQQEVG